jgi:putative flippase GtrA
MPDPAALPRHSRSLPFYVGAGGIATASHYATTIAAVEALSIEPIAATTIGFAIGAAAKYWLNYTAVFRSRARHTRAIVRFAITLGAMIALNALVFRAFEHGLGLHYILAQAITTVLLIAPGYLVHRHWVFRRC